MTVTFTSRFVAGASHALLHDRPVLQLAVLFTGQLLVLAAIMVSRRSFVSKCTLGLFMVEYLLRVVLYGILLLEVAVERHPSGRMSCFDEHVAGLLITITLLTIMQVVSPISVEAGSCGAVKHRSKKRIIKCKGRSKQKKTVLIVMPPKHQRMSGEDISTNLNTSSLVVGLPQHCKHHPRKAPAALKSLFSRRKQSADLPILKM